MGNLASGLSVAAVPAPDYDPAVYTAPAVTPPTTNVAVSALPFMAASNGWGPVERNRSVGQSQPGDGRTLSLRGATFTTGLGAHANSDISLYTGGHCTTFTAIVGVDDETAGKGSVTFTVLADGRQIAHTGTLTGTSAAQTITANITAARQIDLMVSDAGDGTGNDHADWADARLTCQP
jgi:hypothetical protein